MTGMGLQQSSKMSQSQGGKSLTLSNTLNILCSTLCKVTEPYRPDTPSAAAMDDEMLGKGPLCAP